MFKADFLDPSFFSSLKIVGLWGSLTTESALMSGHLLPYLQSLVICTPASACSPSYKETMFWHWAEAPGQATPYPLGVQPARSHGHSPPGFIGLHLACQPLLGRSKENISCYVINLPTHSVMMGTCVLKGTTRQWVSIFCCDFIDSHQPHAYPRESQPSRTCMSSISS